MLCLYHTITDAHHTCRAPLAPSQRSAFSSVTRRRVLVLVFIRTILIFVFCKPPFDTPAPSTATHVSATLECESPSTRHPSSPRPLHFCASFKFMDRFRARRLYLILHQWPCFYAGNRATSSLPEIPRNSRELQLLFTICNGQPHGLSQIWNCCSIAAVIS